MHQIEWQLGFASSKKYFSQQIDTEQTENQQIDTRQVDPQQLLPKKLYSWRIRGVTLYQGKGADSGAGTWNF